MTQVVIDDIVPKTQLIATAAQTVFNTNWTADAATDVDVYARASGVEADDETQLVSPSLYNVTFIGVSETVRVTFLSGRTADDIITIVRNTPADRTNLYINTNFVPSMLNQDFGVLTLVDQQNQMYDTRICPHYNVSAIIEPVIDIILPILEANQVWAMNSSRTAIIAYNVPSGGGIAPSDAKYLIQTADSELPNAQAMGSLASGLVVNTITTGVQLTRILTGITNQTIVTNGSGISGNPTVGIADNAIFPGVEGVGIPTGTTAQRPVSHVGTDFRFNSDLIILEYWDGSNWVQISETDGVVTAQGTANQVLVNGTSGAPQDGAIILTLPQDIATTSSPTFNALTLTTPLTVANGGTGLATLSAYRILAAGTTATGNLQQIGAGSAGQLLQSNGASALASWTTATFPSGSGTLNHLLRSDGTNWVETGTVTINAANEMAGVAELNVDNLRLDGNIIRATNTNGNISLITPGTGALLYNTSTPVFTASKFMEAVNVSDYMGYAAIVYANDALISSRFTLARSRSTTQGLFTALQPGDTIGILNAYGDDGSAFNVSSGISFRVDASGTVSAGIVPGRIVFSTVNSLGAISEAGYFNYQQNLFLTNPLAETSGGTHQSSYTLGDTLYSSAANTLSKLAGNTTAVKQYLSQTGTGAVSAAPVWATIDGGDITGAALTKTDDTNVTLTLGGTPTTALLRAASLTLGWTGQLDLTRGGTAASLTASNGGIVYSNASNLAILAGTATAGQMLQSGASTTPSWSTTTYPATNAINTIMYASSANVLGSIAAVNNAVLISSAGGVPSMSTTLPSGIAATNMNLTTPTLGVASATSINFGGSALSTYATYTSSSPVVTFATNGDLSVSYATQNGRYSRIGNIVTYEFELAFTPTFTTSSGNLQISVPFANNGLAAFGNCFIQSPTWPAARTSIALEIQGGASQILVVCSGTATSASAFSTSNILTTIAYIIYGAITYLA